MDTFRASRVRVGWEPLMNPIMFCLNYHVVHHVRPRIPFYLWVKAWNETEADYSDRAVPIRTAWGRQLTHSEYRAWRKTTRSGRADGLTGAGRSGEESMFLTPR
jgi:beta-carotene hydroxylase